MMVRRLNRDDRGAAAVEMALALPIVFLFIYGIFQVGAVFAANALMQAALGEGARFATIWPAHTDAEIKTRIQSEVRNIYAGTFVVSDPSTTMIAATSTVGATRRTVLTITYTVTPDMMFFTMPTMNIVRTKTAYMPIEA